ncbi:MAG: ATP-binding protein, partial [Erysipelotrichaceae bacterium]|jgi:ATP-dependent DNA helicase RecG|nr:hypothetical protein [Erysipelotrichaceae bacterium]NLH63929.1 ATP-binding protein [Erysipelotrichaceae bacterium]
MLAESLKQLIIEVTAQQAEPQTIELKAAERGCPTRLFDTLSSFSN